MAELGFETVSACPEGPSGPTVAPGGAFYGRGKERVWVGAQGGPEVGQGQPLVCSLVAPFYILRTLQATVFRHRLCLRRGVTLL